MLVRDDLDGHTARASVAYEEPWGGSELFCVAFSTWLGRGTGARSAAAFDSVTVAAGLSILKLGASQSVSLSLRRIISAISRQPGLAVRLRAPRAGDTSLFNARIRRATSGATGSRLGIAFGTTSSQTVVFLAAAPKWEGSSAAFQHRSARPGQHLPAVDPRGIQTINA